MVRKKRKPKPPEPAMDDDEYLNDMKELLDDEEHMDAVFVVPGTLPHDSNSNAVGIEDEGSLTYIKAHKCVLTARSDYFKALFRNGGASKHEKPAFKESLESTIHVDGIFTETHIRSLLEFIYTNRIKRIRDMSTDDLLCLLHLSDKWLLRDLKRLVEHELIRSHMCVHNVARIYGATEDFRASRLAKACIDFIMSNLREIAGNEEFEEEMKSYPNLCIPVLKAAASMIPDSHQHVHKKQRTEHGSTPAAAGIGSSPVPDNEP